MFPILIGAAVLVIVLLAVLTATLHLRSFVRTQITAMQAAIIAASDNTYIRRDLVLEKLANIDKRLTQIESRKRRRRKPKPRTPHLRLVGGKR